MPQVTSRDGTTIAYDRTGEGPPLIVVGGAFSYRSFSGLVKLAERLSDRFTVVNYDRRGRGDSGDTQPYSLWREVEDIEALIDALGGSACLYGISSGAALALEAATRLDGVERLALYEAPFIVDDSRAPVAEDFVARVDELVAGDRRSEAVKLFMREAIEMPAAAVALMRILPVWSKLKAIVHTLPYDLRIVDRHQRGTLLERARWATLTAPTLVIDGAKSPDWMRNGMQALSEALPTADYRTLDGQTHMVKAKALAPVLAEFLGARPEVTPRSRTTSAGVLSRV